MIKSEDIHINKVINEKFYVAIGASAGGLEAIESFFKGTPKGTGLIFIVIQHLSPDYKSFMGEIISRYTNLEIFIASDGMETQPNKIYLIPPGKNLSIFNGNLYLEKQLEHNYLTLPIDIFFKSLAKDVGSRGIGVILSGTGSDGSLGLRSIKEAGGITIVQDEKSAKFDGMPKNAILTGIVDYILRPEEMIKEIMSFLYSPKLYGGPKNIDDEVVDSNSLVNISLILKDHCNIDFSSYKPNTIIRRLDRRIKINKCNNLNEYIEILKEDDSEKDILYKEFLIGVTSFFRDPEAFYILKNKVIPNIDFSKKEVRIWTAGVSTGEEAYSIAILIYEYMKENNIDCHIRIFATDIDTKALEIASNGSYSESLIADVSDDFKNKYFIKIGENFEIIDTIRKMIVFAKHNILKDPTFSRLDLVVCRNLFIYIKPKLQKNILNSFYYSMLPNAYMFLGSSESIGDMQNAFSVIDSKWKIFQYKKGYKPEISSSVLYAHNRIPLEVSERKNSIVNNIKIESILMGALSNTLPPSIIVDSNGDILQVINNVSNYINTQPGRFSNNFNSNMSKELSLYVNNLLRKVKSEKKEIIFKNIPNHLNKDKLITIKGKAIKINNMYFFIISFLEENKESIENIPLEINMTNESKERVKKLEIDLQLAREGLQATIEELETSNEELQSSNEELIASNEELQSTNEELQSVNEELHTVNNEYQRKIDELLKLNNDLNNLIKNTNVGALYLDKKLCIRKFTPIIQKVSNIVETDIGRPISHISFMENYPEFIKDINKVVDELVGVDKEILDSGGIIWLVKLRPYRSEYNAVDGVIITMVDISNLKKEQSINFVNYKKLENIMELNKLAWWEYDLISGHVKFSPQKATMIGYSVDEFPTQVYDICKLIHPEDYERTMQSMRDYVEGKSKAWDVKYRIRRKDGSYAWYHDQGRIVERNKDNVPTKIIGTVVDISTLNK